VTTADEQNERVTAYSSPRHVHIVDATQGPLIGDERLHRIIPFAITATLSLVVAVPATSWIRPNLAIAGAVLIATTILASMTFPWTEVARSAQLSIPFLFLFSALLLASAAGSGIGSPFVTVAVLPLIWLAIYESRGAVLLAATLAGAGLWLVVPEATVQTSNHGFVATFVFVVCGAGMGITLHGLVWDARKLALELRDHQLALEDAAAMLDTLPERVNRYRLPDLAITYCNAAWAAQYNVDPAQAIGRPLDQFLSDDELVGLNSQLAILGPDNPILVDTVARAVSNESGQWLEWVDRYLMGVDGPEVNSGLPKARPGSATSPTSLPMSCGASRWSRLRTSIT
jgi:PAS domain-containing protein